MLFSIRTNMEFLKRKGWNIEIKNLSYDRPYLNGHSKVWCRLESKSWPKIMCNYFSRWTFLKCKDIFIISDNNTKLTNECDIDPPLGSKEFNCSTKAEWTLRPCVRYKYNSCHIRATIDRVFFRKNKLEMKNFFGLFTFVLAL